MPLLNGTMKERAKPPGFTLCLKKIGKRKLEDVDFVRDTEGVWIDGKFRLVSHPAADKAPARLTPYGIFTDPAHKTDLSAKQSEDVARMQEVLDEWRASVPASFDGKNCR